MIDIIKILEEYRIPYITRGPNVARGNVNVACPWCADNDPSMHLGIDLDRGWFGCWRNSTHRGKNVARLLQRLIKCSWAEACLLAGKKDRTHDLIMTLDALFNPPESTSNSLDMATGISLPRNFYPLYSDIRNDRLARPFIRYLENRGFTGDDLEHILNYYNLHYCLDGRWKNRIILPVYYQFKLVSWTARSIDKSEELRYMSLTQDKAKAEERGDPVGGIGVSRLLLDYDSLMINQTDSEHLFLCEGPFDAIKLDILGISYNIRTTCLFTLATTPEQESLLVDLADIYKIHILLDSGAYHNSIKLQERLSVLNPIVEQLPPGYKDPGELDIVGVEALLGGRFGTKTTKVPSKV